MNMKRSTTFALLLVFLSAVSVSAQLSTAPAIGGPDRDERTTQTPTLHWEKLDNASWYRIWMNNKTQGTTAFKQWVKGANSWTIPDSKELNPNDEYRFWVAGWNSNDSLGPWSSPADFQAGKVHHVRVAPGDFLWHEGDTMQISGLNNTGIYHIGTDGAEVATADFDLPDGAVVTELEVTVEDEDSSGDLGAIELREYGPGGTVPTSTMASISYSGTTQGTEDFTTSSISPDTVDSAHYYVLHLEFPNTGENSTIAVYSARVTYIK